MSSMESPRHEAAEATCLWLRHDHESCIQTLQRLELDPALCDCPLKVLHNLHVVEHYSNKRRDPAWLLEQLTHLLNEAASKAAEHATPPAPTPRSHHTTPAHQPEQVLMVPLDEGVANLKVNKALLLYREQRYDEATQLLGPVLQQVEGLDEGTALHALLLQLDISLHQHDVPQAASLLLALEKACPGLAAGFAAMAGPGTDEDQQQQQQQQAGHAAPLPSSPSATARAAVAAAAKAPPSPATPPPAPHASSSLAPAPSFGLEPLAGASDLPHALPFVSKWSSGAMKGARALLGQPTLAPPNLALLVHMFRIRLALLQHNTRAAKRELRAMLAYEASQAAAGSSPSFGVASTDTPASASTAGGHDALSTIGAGVGAGVAGAGAVGVGLSMSRTTALCRAHVEVLRGSCRKAAHALGTLLQESSPPSAIAAPSVAAAAAAADSGAQPQGTASGQGPAVAAAMQPVLLNDLGVVHHYGGRPELAAACFQQARACLHCGGGEGSQAAQGSNAGSSLEQQQQQQQQGDASGSLACSSFDSWAVTYNLGLQRLVLAQHEAALRCFEHCLAATEGTSGLAVHRPLLLLRAAQAALGLSAQQAQQGQQQGQQQEGLEKQGQQQLQHKEQQEQQAGGGQAQALLLQALLWLQAAHEAMEAQQQQRHDAAAAALTAASAAAAAGLGHGHGSHADLFTLSLPTDGGLLPQDQGRACVQQSILSHLAYVHLQLGDQDAALAAATQLLGMPDLAPAQAQAAACYAAEVLAARGREGEAVALLASTHHTAAAALAAAAAAAAAARARAVVLSCDGSLQEPQHVLTPQQPLQQQQQVQQQQGGGSPEVHVSHDGAAFEAPAASSPVPGVGLGVVGAALVPGIGTLAASPVDECALRGARTCHAALCANLSAALLGQAPAPASGPTQGPSVISESGAASDIAPAVFPSGTSAPYSLASEALQQDPGCAPAGLVAAYLDMMSGRGEEALQRVRAMAAQQLA